MTIQASSLKVSADAGRRERGWQAPALCLVLAALTFAVFGRTMGFKFVNYDDGNYVYDNPVVSRGLTLKGIVWAFSGHASNWHPLTWLSHMLDCQLYGLHPGGHHLTNVFLHTATVIVLFLVLRRMTGALWRSAFVAAVFAIHPLRVESVAWVAERKDVLSGLFFMLTLGAYVRYVRLPWSPVRYGLVLVLFALGLMCKPMLVTLPVVLLLLDYWPLQRKASIGRLVLEKLPLLALCAASCVVTLLAQSEAIQENAQLPLPLRLANALAACMVYLGQMVYPSGLAVFYPYPLNGLLAWKVALAGTLLAGLSAVAVWQRRRQPWILVGWLWYLVMLLPVVGVIQVGSQAHADRYTYLPQIGVYLAATWWVAQWRLNRAALGILMTGVVGVLMVCAWKQTANWKDSETLWIHALACTTSNDVADLGIGNALDQKGSLQEAMVHYQEALKLNPDNVDARNNLGNDLRQMGRVDEAIAHYQKALQIRPGFAAAHYNLGIALGQKGRVNEAIAQYQEALQINPDYVDAHVNLGSALLQTGRLDEAIEHLQKALQINPCLAKTLNNLGNAFLQKGNEAEAIAQFQQAVRLEPDDPWPKNNLAWLLATSAEAALRNGRKAVELAAQASELAGGKNPIVLHTLAAALAEAGRFSEAVETAQRALHLAESQSNARLAGALQSEIKLYQAGRPFQSPERTH
ncbi:MAG: tetratricopeptide repeat protein [Limisphaerales bacterium]